jgi:hypothetical protein
MSVIMTLASVISTRRVWFLHAECNFHTHCDFDTHECDNYTQNCDFNTHKSDFYEQSVIMKLTSVNTTRMSVISTRRVRPLHAECNFDT